MTIATPLLLQNPIEKIDQIDPAQVESAIKSIIQDNLAAIEKLLEQKDFTWQNLILPLEQLENRLNKAWSPVSHLNSVANSDDLRKAYDAALAHLTKYSTQLGQHQALFNAYNSLFEKREEQQLSKTRQHILEDALLGFKLSGLHLKAEDKITFGKIQGRLAELKSKFEQNILDATMSWSKNLSNEQALAGLPETEMAMLKASAETNGETGYRVSLEIPSYLAVMTYADDRALREEVYYAYTTRASELGHDKGRFDNSDIMGELLALKERKAKLLGYANFAELSLQTKMAENPQAVFDFLTQLGQASRSQALKEFKELQTFAKDSGQDELQAWDLAYYSEKLKQKNYQISQAELRPYFPLEKVLNGLFAITKTHFSVSFKATSDRATWHKDVQHFEILRENKVIAEFYLDLFARAHKRGGAWMDSYQGRFIQSDSQLQIPIAYLTCNFAPPVADKPALMTHDEVVTLFHEFGHGIHHMLTQVDELSASGISNVPWDAVELPSQFMENFCYEPEVIKQLSGHYETSEALPQALLEKLIKAKNFQSAMQMLRQLEFALFDMKIHASDALSSKQIQSQLDDIRAQVSVMPAPEFNRFQHGFSHIFAGGYSAGYYSYKWAEVLSADAFSLFEEDGVMNPQAGKKFRECILEKGGSQDPMDLFVAFRGRKPTVDALLRHSGIAAIS